MATNVAQTGGVIGSSGCPGLRQVLADGESHSVPTDRVWLGVSLIEV